MNKLFKMKCPNCGGDKITAIDETMVKCMYCGTIFNIKEDNSLNVTQQVNKAEAPFPEKEHVWTEGNADNRTTQIKIVGKNKLVAALLAILLGGLGLHKFYFGKIGKGILYLVFCWTYIPSIIGLIEGIIYLSMSDEDFNRKYNS